MIAGFYAMGARSFCVDSHRSWNHKVLHALNLQSLAIGLSEGGTYQCYAELSQRHNALKYSLKVLEPCLCSSP